jgi:hypothetical protein
MDSTLSLALPIDHPRFVLERPSTQTSQIPFLMMGDGITVNHSRNHKCLAKRKSIAFALAMNALRLACNVPLPA